MSTRLTDRKRMNPGKDYFPTGMISILVIAALFLSGCALFRERTDKEPSCLVAPEHLVGLYGTRIPSAGPPVQMIRLRLLPGSRADMITDFPDGKHSLIENGQWECRSSTVKVKLTGQVGKKYEKPEIIMFTIDGEGLTPFQHHRDSWGSEDIRLERNPAVIGIVWRLVQIQYANNTAMVPDDPAKYALILSQDGTVTVRADCNRGMGTYLMAGPWLFMRKYSYTRMICPENSLFDHYTKALETAESCTLRDGNLYVTLRGNSGVMKFEPAKLAE